jgi:hypothetical protein
MRTPLKLLLGLALAHLPSSGAFARDVFTEQQIKGVYTFAFDGYVLPDGKAMPVAAAGSIDIHWRGDAVTGEDGETIMTEVDASGARTISFGGVICTNEFACHLYPDSDGMGNATCVPYNVNVECPLSLPRETFTYFVEDNGRGFRYVGTDTHTTILGRGRRR